jgi:hypothetical protein
MMEHRIRTADWDGVRVPIEVHIKLTMEEARALFDELDAHDPNPHDDPVEAELHGILNGVLD